MFRKYFVVTILFLIVLFIILATLEFRKNKTNLGFGIPAHTTTYLAVRLG